MSNKLTLKVLSDRYCVCRLDVDANIPDWTMKSEWFSITRTDDELSIVCKEVVVPEEIVVERGWKILKVDGVLDFALVGILSKLSQLMADNDISIFAISTYDTDYILVKEDKLKRAIEVYKENGYEVI